MKAPLHTTASPASPAATGHRHRPGGTQPLLAAGAAAGPVYVLLAAGQMLARDGFDPRHHAVSLLANGDWGWVQSANFLVVGLLTIAGAVGIRRAFPRGPGRRWGPLLIGVYGVSLLVAGIFSADPAGGFPPGTPAGQPASLSWHAGAHFVAGGVGFAAFVGACAVFARGFRARAQRGWAALSAATGVVFLAAFAGVAAGPPTATANVAFGLAVMLAWGWFTALALHVARAPAPAAVPA
jgi:hypothetical protein